MSKIIVVGDIHGDLNQLLYPLLEFFKNRNEYRKIVFLGDYIDRGDSNVFIYEIIRFIMEDMQNKDIIFLRGNHESYDAAVYDYIYPSSTYRKFMKSFIFDGFAKLKLDIVHYDELTNILFSHSPLSRDLNVCLAMNEQKMNMEANGLNTFTNDKETSKMKYRNIHGHNHYMSDSKTIKDFFNEKRKMICLDDDASYGIRLVERLIGNTGFNLSSHVKYAIITNNTYSIESKNILFNSSDDFNSKSFDYIKQKLFKNMNVSDEMKRKLNYEHSKEILIQTLKTKNINKELIINIHQSNKTKAEGVMIYYQDVPYDIWKDLGILENDCNIAGYVVWKHIVNNDKISNKILSNKKSLCGGYNSFINTILKSKTSNEMILIIKTYATLFVGLTFSVIVSILVYYMIIKVWRTLTYKINI